MTSIISDLKPTISKFKGNSVLEYFNDVIEFINHVLVLRVVLAFHVLMQQNRQVTVL
jgi:hypothetical protein